MMFRLIQWRQLWKNQISLIVLSMLFASAPAVGSLPQSVKSGVLDFYLTQGNALAVLNSLATDDYQQYPLHVALSQNKLQLSDTFDENTLVGFIETQKNKRIKESLRLMLAELFFTKEDCQTALKYLKGKARYLSDYDKTKRAYLRGKCFIEYGKHNYAAQSLSGAIDGELAANAYYNLAADYAATSRNPKRALVALKVARDINSGANDSSKELTNRVNLSAGALYLENQSPDLASQFFDQIDLDSVYATQALYLAGLARYEKRDYRAAIQAWTANQQRLLVEPGVSESYLALPAAQAIAGYQTQALESYMRASALFEEEVQRVQKLGEALKKYGAVEVLIDRSENKDLAWFLDKEASGSNSYRDSYLKYLARDQEFFQTLEEYEELDKQYENFVASLQQINSVDSGLRSQQARLKTQPSSEQIQRLEAMSKNIAQRLNTLKSGLQDKASQSIEEKLGGTITKLNERVDSLKRRAELRKKMLTAQRKKISAASNKIQATLTRISSLQSKLALILTERAVAELAVLESDLLAYYEKVELGLIQILESQARLKTKRTNLLDGRYQ